MSKLSMKMAKLWFDPADAVDRVPIILLVEKTAHERFRRAVLGLLDGKEGDDFDDQLRMHFEDVIAERAAEL